MIRDMKKELIKALSVEFRIPMTKFPSWNLGSTLFIELPVNGLPFAKIQNLMNILPANAAIKSQRSSQCLVVVIP